MAPGTHVSLTLTNGKKVKGMLIADIDDADLRERSLAGKTVALGAAVGAGATLGFLVILALLYGSD